MSETWRTCIWAIVVVAVLVFSGGYVPAVAEDECKIEVSSGWSSGVGAAKMIVKNNQKRCGEALYSVPANKVFVEIITVVKPPQNGTVTIEVPRFFYIPKVGFTGQDRFTLSAEGPARDKGRVKLMGEVTVQVNP